MKATGDEARSVIAGYHWFTDCGRDMRTSLEGLTPSTGRQVEAGLILRTYPHDVRDGSIGSAMAVRDVRPIRLGTRRLAGHPSSIDPPAGNTPRGVDDRPRNTPESWSIGAGIAARQLSCRAGHNGPAFAQEMSCPKPQREINGKSREAGARDSMKTTHISPRGTNGSSPMLQQECPSCRADASGEWWMIPQKCRLPHGRRRRTRNTIPWRARRCHGRESIPWMRCRWRSGVSSKAAQGWPPSFHRRCRLTSVARTDPVQDIRAVHHGGHMNDIKRLPRSSGILLHVSSLPGDHGIGDLGPAAHEFLEFLERTGQSLWQMLPVGPTGYGSSPYQSPSTFAGNPLFVSLERLAERGWLTHDQLQVDVPFRTDQVEFDRVTAWKHERLALAYEQFAAEKSEDYGEFLRFREEEALWLNDYTLFIALKEEAGGVAWPDWPADLAARDPAALQAARLRLATVINREAFVQFQFARQWTALRQQANARGIRIIGDVPIFVAHDSSDVWAHRELFHLNEEGRPTLVAGVPPDYFSETGQLWGNPLYRWDVLAQHGFEWWIQRLRHAFELFDLVRIDHFRGMEAYWEIPGDAPTAASGRWVTGPGIQLFRVMERALGPLPLIAEDLGLITPEVDALREDLGAPGMRVLQFGFGGDPLSAYHRPHSFPRHAVVYTGTHDNNTTTGWFRSQPGEGTTQSAEEITQERARLLEYLGTDGSDIAWDVLRLAWASVADTALAPLQDVLSLGTKARFNLPGTSEGNWGWRVAREQLTPALEARLRQLTSIYDRQPGCRPSPAGLPE
ncbi:MAG: 4-alpha-glucanotransferase [Planctomycetaceae bacterium]|nr:4-alpha-glucanotransferase [Planctomycetaceae bacterium]